MKDLILSLLQSSIGRKFLMALTGLGAIAFLVVHLGGNLIIFAGRDEFNSYAEHLHSVPFLPLMEAGLAALFIAHIALSIVLTVQNRRARPIGYAVSKSSGGSNAASSTMIYSGVAVLAFMAFHIWNVKFGHSAHITAFQKITDIFSSPAVAVFYILGVMAVGLHLFHGASSTFQSLGIKYPKLDSMITVGGRLSAVVVAFGFASVPVFVWLVLKGG